MSTAVTVSVGLPVFNGGAYLSEAIESVLGQSFQDFELIVSDNASFDNTPQICADYARRDDRVRYVGSRENRGAAWNFNRVFHLSRGIYFKWINHDDRWHPDLLKRSVQTIEAAPAGVALCYPETVFIDEDGNAGEIYEDRLDLRSAEPAERLSMLLRQLRRCNALFGLVRADTLRRTRLLGGYIDADRVLLAELALLGQFWEIDQPMFERRMHPGGSTFVNVTRAQSAAWWDPTSRQIFHFPNWRVLREHVGALRHVPLTSTERRRCALSLARTWPAVYGKPMAGDVKAMIYRLAVGAQI